MKNISQSPPHPLQTYALRTAAGYRLVLFDRLSDHDRIRLGDLVSEPGLYGILQPVDPKAGQVKAVPHATALLWLTLREPGLLPRYVLEGPEAEERLQDITSLVLDGVFEIQNGNLFISGAAALPLLNTKRKRQGGSASHGPHDLSVEALRHVSALRIDDEALLRQRLYAYNGVPMSRRWRQTYPDAEAVASALGAIPGGATHARLEDTWEAHSPDAEKQAWFSWSRRGADRPSATQPTFKLYISPAVEAVGNAFAALSQAIGRTSAFHLKVGATAAGLLRPDKIVLYFASLEELAAAGQILTDRLGGLPAQGVPFTAALGTDGLLSWGLDPPRKGQDLVAHESSSWRYWITARLAAAMAQARREGESEPWRFARERLRLENIDVERWEPPADFWKRNAR